MSIVRNAPKYRINPRTKKVRIQRYRGTDAGFHSPKVTDAVREWRAKQ